MTEPAASDALRRLIEQLDETAPLVRGEQERLREARRFDFFRKYTQEDVTAHHEAHRPTALDFLREPGAQTALKAMQDDLAAHVCIVDAMFSDWLRLAEWPAPHYANRILAILRKQRLFDLERAFLRAYSRHFYSRAGATDAKMAERADVLGVAPGKPPAE